jgi:hypothetical protein
MVALAFLPGPFQAALFVALRGDFLPPRGNGSLHYAPTGCQGKIFDFIAGPFFALVA